MPIPPEKPNLDLIQMVQKARMAHDRAAIPSAVSAVYWIESKPLVDVQPPTARAGEWVIATTLADVDALWSRIKAATEKGELGYKSKVSTSPAKGQADPAARVIVVRTRDADDAADVTRVEGVLRGIGITTMRYERIADDIPI
jgi:Domain of unknown function (DUF1917)